MSGYCSRSVRGRTDSLVGVRRWHADVDDRDVRALVLDQHHQLLGIARFPDHLAPCLAEQPHDACAHEKRVVSDDYAHGISARIARPLAGRARNHKPSPERLDAIAQPSQTRAARADRPPSPVVGDLELAAPSWRPTRTCAVAPGACLTMFVSASATT